MLWEKAIKSVALWFLAFVALGLLGALSYAVKTSWQNQERLTQLTEESNARLSQIGSDIQGLRRSMIRMLLKGNPADASIADDLVSGTALQGIGQFRSGEFSAAYSTWSAAAERGDKDAAFAIATANATLKEKLKDPSVAADDRQSIEAALEAAPEVVEDDSFYFLKGGN